MRHEKWRIDEDFHRDALWFDCIKDGESGNISRYKRNNDQGAVPVKKHEPDKSKKLSILKPQRKMDYVAEAERILSVKAQKSQRPIEILDFRQEPKRAAQWFRLVDTALVGICLSIVGLLVYALFIV